MAMYSWVLPRIRRRCTRWYYLEYGVNVLGAVQGTQGFAVDTVAPEQRHHVHFDVESLVVENRPHLFTRDCNESGLRWLRTPGRARGTRSEVRTGRESMNVGRRHM